MNFVYLIFKHDDTIKMVSPENIVVKIKDALDIQMIQASLKLKTLYYKLTNDIEGNFSISSWRSFEINPTPISSSIFLGHSMKSQNSRGFGVGKQLSSGHFRIWFRGPDFSLVIQTLLS